MRVVNPDSFLFGKEGIVIGRGMNPVGGQKMVTKKGFIVHFADGRELNFEDKKLELIRSTREVQITKADKLLKRAGRYTNVKL